MKNQSVEVITGAGDSTETPMLLEPFFRKRSETIRIQRLQTLAERRKFSDAFALVGCLRCQSKVRAHGACGLCTVCYRWYKNILQRVLRARTKGELE
jgi:hypothetical protein